MGGKCGVYEGEERCIQCCLRERDHLGDPGIDGMIVLKCIKKENGGTLTGLIWIDRDRRRAVVNAIMNR
jgi:hypothetical protein